MVCGKKNFLMIHALGNHDLLLYPLSQSWLPWNP
jgi:hypothetical protein